MSSRGPIEYSDASPEACAMFDDIKRTRQVEDVNNLVTRIRLIETRGEHSKPQ